MTIVEQIMHRLGFSETDNGPYVSELRKVTARHVSEGMVTRSRGTWVEGSENLTAEERAKEYLRWEWEIQHEHSYRVECLDGPMLVQRDVRTGRIAAVRFNLRAWLGDRRRELQMRLRLLRDRKLQNPYS